MRKTITINIPEPCHENWKEMTPTEKGRHCQVCDKTVIDFTNKSDEQIIKAFDTKGKVCGRFKDQQLNREIVLARKDKNNYLSFLASGFLTFLAFGNQEMYAQKQTKTVQVDTIKVPKVKGKLATSVLNEKVITGTVTTISDGLPLPGATVIIKGKTIGTQTDFDGKYTIKAKLGDVLVISYIAMETKEITVGIQTKIDLALIENETLLLGEVITVGYSIPSATTYHCNTSEDYPLNLEAPEKERAKSRELRTYNLKWKERNKAKRTKWKNERLANREAIKNGSKPRTDLGKIFHKIKTLFSEK